MKRLKAILHLIRCDKYLLITKFSCDVYGYDPEREHLSNADISDQLDMAVVAKEKMETAYSQAMDNYFYETSLN